MGAVKALTRGPWQVSVGRDSTPGMYWIGTVDKPELIGVSVLPCGETRQASDRVAAFVEALNRFDGQPEPNRAMRRIFDQVWCEQERAHAKHGATSLRAAGVLAHRRVTVCVEELGEVAEVLNDHDHGKVGRAEALELLRGELVQLAAMACDWALSIDQERDAAARDPEEVPR